MSEVPPKSKNDDELIVDALTNRRNIMRQLNQREQMAIGVKQMENICCNFINNVYDKGSTGLLKTLVEEVNQQFTNKSIVNSIHGTLMKIVGDVLEDTDTNEVILKHLRGGCFVEMDVEENIQKKKKIMAEMREKEFIQKLNQIGSHHGGGGDDDGISAINSPFKIDVDPPEKIQNTLCSEIFIRMFKSRLFSSLNLKQIARDMIETTIRKHPTIKSSMSSIVVQLLKSTFDAKTMKPIFMEKLAGGCYKRKAISGEPFTSESAAKKQTKQAPIQLIPLQYQMPKSESAQPSESEMVGGSCGTKQERTKKKNRTKTRTTYKRVQLQKGGYEVIQRLSFDTLINRAYPIIKSCLCDCIKNLYQNATPEVFKRYQEFSKISLKSPTLIDHATANYGRILDKYVHSSEKQIKIDIRNHVLDKCPPLQDPEIKFSGKV